MIRYPKISILMGLVSFTLVGLAADWPQWRGPDRDGILRSFEHPDSWPSQLRLAWKIPVGIGHSSPILVGENIFQFSRMEEDEVLSCIDLHSGKVRWQKKHSAPYEMNPAARSHGKGPKSTPLFYENKIFTFGISGILSSHRADDGELIWRKSFAGRFSRTSPLYGTAMSVAIDQGVLYAHVGGHDGGALTAFEPNSGIILWTWDGDGPGYASPIIVNPGGIRMIVTQSQDNIVGVEAASGKLLWKIPFKTAYTQNAVTPAFHDGVLLFSGLNNGITAMRIGARSDRLSPEVIWKSEDLSMYMNSPVILNGLMYGFAHERRGQVFCLDTLSGNVIWTSEGRQGQNAAIIGTMEALFVLTDDAELQVAKTGGDRYELLGRYIVADSPTWAHPVILEDGILIKDESHLARWRW